MEKDCNSQTKDQSLYQNDLIPTHPKIKNPSGAFDIIVPKTDSEEFLSRLPSLLKISKNISQIQTFNYVQKCKTPFDKSFDNIYLQVGQEFRKAKEDDSKQFNAECSLSQISNNETQPKSPEIEEKDPLKQDTAFQLQRDNSSTEKSSNEEKVKKPKRGMRKSIKNKTSMDYESMLGLIKDKKYNELVDELIQI